MISNHASPNHSFEPEPQYGRGRLSTADFGMVKLWEALSRRWLIVCLGVLLGGLLSVVYSLTWPKTYESSAKVLVMRKDPTVTATGVTRGTEVEGPQVTSELLATHMVLLKSRKIVSEALERDGLDNLPSILKRLKVAQGQTPADYVIENMTVTAGGEGPAQDAHVLNVAFRHSSPQETKAVVQSVVKRYHEFLNEKFVDLNSEAAQLIVEARTNLEQELKNVEEEYRNFRQSAPLLWSSQQGVMNSHRIQYEELQKQLAALEAQSSEAQSRLQLAEKAFEEIKQRGGAGLEMLAIIDANNTERVNLLASVQQGEAHSAQFQSMQPERTAAAQTQYASLPDLLAREKTLLQDFGPSHPEVLETRNTIATLSEFMDNRANALKTGDQERLDPEKLVNAYLALLKHDAASLKQREENLRQLSNREEEGAKSIVKFELQEEELRSRLERTQQLYTAVVDRLRDINLAKDYGGFIHEVIAAPKLGQGVWPQLLLCGVLGTFAGLVVGCSGAIALELRDGSFHNPAEIEQALELPVLTHVPRLPAKNAKRATAGASQVNPLVVAFHRPQSPEAEVFRGLRTWLFSREQQQTLKVIALTSPVRGDGKSVTTANLAVSLAQAGRRVLLVDCNLRGPRVHEFFGLANDCGLMQVLSGEIDPPDAIQTTTNNHLSILPAGDAEGSPSELLASPGFRQLLDWARDHYDHVLLDCPSVLAVSDPSIVAPLANAVILLTRVNDQAKAQLLRSRSMLADVGAHVIGTVVNAWNLRRRSYGYRSRYDYRSDYDDAYENDRGELAYESREGRKN